MPIKSIVIGSLDGYWKKIGRVTTANLVALTPFKESDIDTATAGSLLKYEVEKGVIGLMLRCRISTQSGSAAFDLKVARGEEPDLTIANPVEKFYTDIATTVTFTTSGSAVAAQRGGYYADGFSIAGVDYSLKGFGWANKEITTFADFLGFPFQAAVLTAITGTWAELDISYA